MLAKRRTNRRGLVWRCGAVFFGTLLLSPASLAQDADPEQSLGPIGEAFLFLALFADQLPQQIEPRALVWTSIMLGVTAFGVITGVLFVRQRARFAQERAALAADIGSFRTRLDRAEALLGADEAAVISWAANGRPELTGALLGVAAGPRDVARILDFNGWLEPKAAERLMTLVTALRGSGEAFNETYQCADGTWIEADGRVRAGRAILRLRPALGDKAGLGLVAAERDRANTDLAAIHGLLTAAAAPTWHRDDAGSVTWANPAYKALAANGTGTPSPAEQLSAADAAETETPGQTRHVTLDGLSGRGIVSPAFAVSETAVSDGKLAIAVPELARSGEGGGSLSGNLAILNRIGTAVVMFDADRRIVFANRAFRDLWGLEDRWTTPGADHGQILDVLRERQMLPPESDYRAWKERQLEPYAGGDTRIDTWHLPGGRTLRVVSEPQPGGGVTCLFEDETERLTLESRYNALMHVQEETLQAMRESVAVFSSDGRLSFCNPAFRQLWNLPDEMLAARPHIEAVIAACQPLFNDADAWTTLRHAVTDVSDTRATGSGRMARDDKRTVDYATVPLPDGATLITFVDVTDQAASEAALRLRNEALEAADRLKNEFIQHVSYQLRTPLTSVIGFAELLASPDLGALAPKQREYVDHIQSSSMALLAIINNILDLATIDAGAMELNYGVIDIRGAIDDAVDALKDRLDDGGVTLVIEAPDGIGGFEADGPRLRQVLFNLISNAIGFSEAGKTISVICERHPERVIFKVIDEGRGIAPDDLATIFDRFVTRTAGTGHRGAGLGLSIVKSFVELHGGTIAIESEPGRGTTVAVTFPAARATEAEAGTPAVSETEFA